MDGEANSSANRLKQCAGCQRALPLDDYTQSRKHADGYVSKCKSCTRIDSQAWAEEQRAHYKAYRGARKTIEHALRNGWVERAPCEVCGDRLTEPHPPDYAKPLDVRWLCVEHYLQQHRTRK